MRDTQRSRDRNIGRGKGRLHKWRPMWDLILGSQDHPLSRGQMLNHWATRCPVGFGFKSRLSDISMGPPAFFWYPLAWYMIFHPLTFNLLVSIGLRWASCRQRTDGCCFFNNNFIYDSVRVSETEGGGRKLGRERNRLPTRSPIWDSIQDFRITPWVKGRGSTPEPPRHPGSCFLSHSDTLYLFIGAFSLSAFRVIIQRYELCAFVFPEELVFLVTFSGPFLSLLLLVSFFPH